MIFCLKNHRNTLILFFLIIFFIPEDCFSQSAACFKDFDYSTMSGLERIDSRPLPDFFVYCTYDKTGALTAVGSKDQGTVKIIYKDNKRYLFLGAGKERNGYTRVLFQKKIYATDTAFVSEDTMIFKRTQDHSFFIIQLFTKIRSDKPEMKELTFSYMNRPEAEISPLSDFKNYKEWFSIDSVAQTSVLAIIDLKGDLLVKWENLKQSQDYFFNRINCTREQYKEGAMTRPVSLFWLKNSGIIY